MHAADALHTFLASDVEMAVSRPCSFFFAFHANVFSMSCTLYEVEFYALPRCMGSVFPNGKILEDIFEYVAVRSYCRVIIACGCSVKHIDVQLSHMFTTSSFNGVPGTFSTPNKLFVANCNVEIFSEVLFLSEMETLGQ